MEELTIADIKAELNSYIYDLQLLEAKQMKIEQLKTRAEKTTASYSDIPSGGNSEVQDKMAETVTEMLDLINEEIEETNEINAKNMDIEKRILSLEQPYRNILYFRYILGDNLTIVANKINKEYKYCAYLHGKALLLYLEARNKENVKK